LFREKTQRNSDKLERFFLAAYLKHINMQEVFASVILFGAEKNDTQEITITAIDFMLIHVLNRLFDSRKKTFFGYS
jgi:hypothetical protein